MKTINFFVIATISLLSNLVFGAHVISNGNLDCSNTNGQILTLDWTSCSNEKYGNLRPVIESSAHKSVTQLPGERKAKVCFRDQFTEARIYLDNGKFGRDQQYISLPTESQFAYLNVISHDFDDKGNPVKQLPTLVRIRQAGFVGDPYVLKNETILTSDSPDDFQLIISRPPNLPANVVYC